MDFSRIKLGLKIELVTLMIKTMLPDQDVKEYFLSSCLVNANMGLRRNNIFGFNIVEAHHSGSQSEVRIEVSKTVISDWKLQHCTSHTVQPES